MAERRAREPLEIRGREMKVEHSVEKLSCGVEEGALRVEDFDIPKEPSCIALTCFVEDARGSGNDLVAQFRDLAVRDDEGLMARHERTPDGSVGSTLIRVGADEVLTSRENVSLILVEEGNRNREACYDTSPVSQLVVSSGKGELDARNPSRSLD